MPRIIPQNPDGTVKGANAYGTVEGMRDYWSDRGVDLSPRSDDQLAVALVLATDFVDSRYRFVGWQMYRDQGTQWPRGGLSTTFHRGLPDALVKATYMLARRAAEGVALAPDPTHQASGQALTSKKVKAGPVETSYEYAEPTSSRPEATLPSFPDVELVLSAAGLTLGRNGGRVVRG